MNNSHSYTALLNDLTVIRATGDDAAGFLHGQLTQDITGLPPGQARLAGYCTPKGRLLATLLVWRDPQAPQDILALVKADIAPALVKRLSMFVLRAKAKLSIEPAVVAGVVASGQAAGQSVDAFQTPPDATPYQVQQTAQGSWIAAPSADADTLRWWLVLSEDAARPADTPELHAAWQAADIAAGLPWTQTDTQDLFIPQTLNLDLIDGVNFTKGCYPGQEIVARSHYRGTVKRRMAYGVIDSSVDVRGLAGADIFDASRPESPSGRVVNASTYDGRTHLLLEVHLSELGTAEYRLGAVEGPAIALHPLPYPLESGA